jgi:hypothetical protein
MIGIVFIGVWLAWVLYFIIAETIALTNKVADDTLSDKIRDLFHIKTKWGKITWCAAFGLFAFWFMFHILYGANYWF